MFRENSIETCILSRVKQITSPGWTHEISAWAWCTGKTQRDWVEREVGGGIGMGNTCKSMAHSCQCMAKPLQYCKVISLQLIKINGKKKKKNQPANTRDIRDMDSIPGSGRSPGGGHGNPLWYSYLENPHGQRSLVGCSQWDCKESDMTKVT